MAKQLHVNGAAQIMSRTNGTALEPLGFSVDGVTLTFNTYYEDVFVDLYGPKVPFDVQYFLQDVIIECELIYYDLTVLNKWLPGLPGLAVAPGVMGAAGALALQGALTAGINIQSTPVGTGLTSVENCWNFLNCMLVDGVPVKIGTEKTIWNMKWRALPSQQSSGSAGAVLWNTATT